MQRYEKYKDSGIEWIGEIPEQWECKMIKRLSPIKRGASPRPIDNPIYFDNNGEYSWVRIADVSASERYLECTEQTLSELGASLSVKRNPGDFFLSIAGTVGKPIITKIKCCIHDGFVYFPNLKINPEYLYYIFTTGMPYKGLGKWGTQLNLNTDTVGEINIPVPSDNEIESQINFLDRKTAEIDHIIANKQKLIALYEEEKQAIINQAVTKGCLNCDPNECLNYDLCDGHENYDSENDKKNHSQSHNHKNHSSRRFKDSGVEWLGEIPEHWEVVPLTKYLESIVDYRGRTPQKQDSGLFLVTARNIKNGVIDYSLSEEFVDPIDAQNLLERGLPKIGDVLFTTEAPLGEVANIDREDIALAQRIIKFRGLQNVLDNYFLKSFMSCNSFKQDLYTYSTGSTAIGIKASKLHQLKCLLPTINEQQSIVAYIEKECARLDVIIEKFNKQLDLFQEYRTTLISEVVTGKMKVSNIIDVD